MQRRAKRAETSVDVIMRYTNKNWLTDWLPWFKLLWQFSQDVAKNVENHLGLVFNFQCVFRITVWPDCCHGNAALSANSPAESCWVDCVSCLLRFFSSVTRGSPWLQLEWKTNHVEVTCKLGKKKSADRWMLACTLIEGGQYYRHRHTFNFTKP